MHRLGTFGVSNFCLEGYHDAPRIMMQMQTGKKREHNNDVGWDATIITNLNIYIHRGKRLPFRSR